MTSIPKTEAIRQARAAVGHPIRSSATSYHVYGPYYASRPSGPSTEVQKHSYPAALAARTEWVAEVALALMGHPDVFLMPGTGMGEDGTTVPDLVAAGLKRAARGEGANAA